MRKESEEKTFKGQILWYSVVILYTKKNRIKKEQHSRRVLAYLHFPQFFAEHQQFYSIPFLLANMFVLGLFSVQEIIQ